MRSFLSVLFVCLMVLNLALAGPWYQGPTFTFPGRPQSDTTPTGCVDGEPAGWYNNGYPMLCPEGWTCDAAIADAGQGNPCTPPAE